jgi:succinate-acetate transporter protein
MYHSPLAVYANLVFGGILMLLGAVLEFFLGNTFSFVVFASFSAYWMTYGATLTSQFDAFTNYALVGETSGSGAASPVFQAAFGFFLVFMGVLCLIFLACSIRTNIIFSPFSWSWFRASDALLELSGNLLRAISTIH